jgi:diguanylate cyclase (GGDEF)-like protein
MSIFLWVIYIAIGILSLLPIVRIDLFSVSKKYKYFKYVSIALFIWTLITGLTFVISNPLVLYPMLLLKYPLIYFATALAFIAFLYYLEMEVKTSVLWILYSFLAINIVMALTNQWHGLYLDVSYSSSLTADMIMNADPGHFFYIHTVFSYILLFIILFYVIRRALKALKETSDAFPLILIISNILVGIVLNVIHVFIRTFTLDPTYIIYVVFVSFMYFVFYIRDVRLILRLGNYRFILQNLREMFLIVDHREQVVDASQSFLNRFSIELNEGKPLDDVMDKIKESSVVYSSGKDIHFDSDKSFIHMLVKDINIPFLKYPGHMILFYDETKVQKYIHDLNYVMNHDLMTGLFNRNYLESLRETYDSEKTYGCIIFDLDGLKLFNDYLGHHEGDELLKRFANILNRISNENENLIPIRMGGDEFLLIFKDKEPSMVSSYIDEIKKSASDKDFRKHIGFSYGIGYHEEEDDFSNVLSKADVKMYEMKTKREDQKKKLESFLKSKKDA